MKAVSLRGLLQALFAVRVDLHVGRIAGRSTCVRIIGSLSPASLPARVLRLCRLALRNVGPPFPPTASTVPSPTPLRAACAAPPERIIGIEAAARW